MGVAWHRFSAFFNIYFKREADGAVALGPLPADDQRRQADRLRGSGRGRRLRPRQDRGLHLEGDAGLHHLHRVRAVPEPVPGLEHRQAAQPEDAGHGPAGPPLRQGPVPARRADGVSETAPDFDVLQPSDEQAWASGYARIEGTNDAQAHRPLVGTLEEGGVIDPDVLWSCTNCGACVEQCPVDIEHVDHILDMRRYQTLIESNFPSEAGVMLRNLENRGNPWGVGGNVREEWIKELDFEVRHGRRPDPLRGRVPVLGRLRRRHRRPRQEGHQGRRRAACTSPASSSPSSARARPARATRPAAWATSSSSSSWPWRTSRRSTASSRAACRARARSSRPARTASTRSAASTRRSAASTRSSTTRSCSAQLVEEGRLTPVTPVDRKVTYHDPCFLGRHNKVYTPPREILDSVQGLSTQEMHRCKDRGFCCGAGGARMWMEEKIGKRINAERTEEALELDPDVISTACPFCITMLSDALNTKKQNGEAKDHVEVLDVSQILLRSMAPVGAPGTDVRPRGRRRGRRPGRHRLPGHGARRPAASPQCCCNCGSPCPRTDRPGPRAVRERPGDGAPRRPPGRVGLPRRATWSWPTSPGSRRTASCSALRELDVHRDGAIAITGVDAAVSSAARRAEERAPGDAADAVVWEQVVRTTDADSALSVSYLAFLTIAVLLAAIAIINDSAILTIGAMVLGPGVRAAGRARGRRRAGPARRRPPRRWSRSSSASSSRSG